VVVDLVFRRATVSIAPRCEVAPGTFAPSVESVAQDLLNRKVSLEPGKRCLVETRRQVESGCVCLSWALTVSRGFRPQGFGGACDSSESKEQDNVEETLDFSDRA
jgi:hypothetical protein